MLSPVPRDARLYKQSPGDSVLAVYFHEISINLYTVEVRQIFFRLWDTVTESEATRSQWNVDMAFAGASWVYQSHKRLTWIWPRGHSHKRRQIDSVPATLHSYWLSNAIDVIQELLSSEINGETVCLSSWSLNLICCRGKWVEYRQSRKHGQCENERKMLTILNI